MVGRECYHNPMVMRDWDRLFYGDSHAPIEYADLVQRLQDYASAMSWRQDVARFYAIWYAII